jgi:hypothetical protein
MPPGEALGIQSPCSAHFHARARVVKVVVCGIFIGDKGTNEADNNVHVSIFAILSLRGCRGVGGGVSERGDTSIDQSL